MSKETKKISYSSLKEKKSSYLFIIQVCNKFSSTGSPGAMVNGNRVCQQCIAAGGSVPQRSLLWQGERMCPVDLAW